MVSRKDIGGEVLSAVGFLEARGKGPYPTRLSSNNYIRDYSPDGKV